MQLLGLLAQIQVGNCNIIPTWVVNKLIQSKNFKTVDVIYKKKLFFTFSNPRVSTSLMQKLILSVLYTSDELMVQTPPLACKLTPRMT